MSTHPPWFDPAMPRRQDCVLPCLLERNAAARAADTFVRFESGESWSFQETLDEARRTAAALVRLGVEPGDRVLAWLPNGADMLRAWFGASWLGATLVPLNTAYKGRLLQHAIMQSTARLMIAHGSLVGRLADVETAQLDTVIVRGGPSPALAQRPRLLDGAALTVAAATGEAQAVQPWDIMMVIFTSGTTGPSKGVLTTYLQQYTVARVSFGYLTPADTLLVNLPMFLIGGPTAVLGAMTAGAAVALYDGFRTQTFWSDVRRCGASCISGLLGAMISFLLKNPPRDDDADNPLRRVVLSPLTPQTVRLAQRYDFEYFSGFNMTELSVPLVTELNSTAFGSCGRPRSGIECRVVDEHDIELPPGRIGEFVLRSDLPWTMNAGYLGMPEATATAWRNGWFHTGDLMYRDGNGDFFFVDRKKDSIRRRGENISSIEVEVAVDEHPAVAEVAAIAVPSEHGEDDVMVVVAPKPGMGIDPAELTGFLAPRMAHFMVPRYVRVLTELPKTPTNKIRKTELRREGVTADTWDREAAGMRLKREKLGGSTHGT